jgi:hypothetical protein
LISFSNYPKELNISQEIICVLGINWSLSVYSEFIFRRSPNKEICVFGMYNLFSFEELLRSSSIIILLYSLTYKKITRPSIAYVWLFNDLSKFILEPTCYITFIKYLCKNEPTRSL